MKPANGIPKDAAVRWEWIKFQLRARGSSLSILARKLSVERNALNNVKRSPYPRMEKAIADELGYQPEQIWPERYNSDGTPNRQRTQRTDGPSENG